MEMKNPPHPGELIGDSLEELGMSITAAAERVNDFETPFVMRLASERV